MISWAELESACTSCSRCKLCEQRNNVVIGTGNKNAEIMLIGEGPGEQEDLQGIPFVGAAGKLLDSMLSIIDLDRTNCYIANIVKCRPPFNRDPSDEEQAACALFLAQQIALVQPKIIICLGRIAASKMISEDFRITRQHGTWFERNGIHITAMYHPSALLRDVTKRPETFMDLLTIRDMIRQLQIQL